MLDKDQLALVTFIHHKIRSRGSEISHSAFSSLLTVSYRQLIMISSLSFLSFQMEILMDTTTGGSPDSQMRYLEMAQQ